MDQLKKCPRCGGYGKLYKNYGFVYVQCELCELRTVLYQDHNEAEDEEKAINEWNGFIRFEEKPKRNKK